MGPAEPCPRRRGHGTLDELLNSERQTPRGRVCESDERWVKRTAAALGLESSLNPPGRPQKRARADSEAGGLFGAERP
jgi:hypothetical protein